MGNQLDHPRNFGPHMRGLNRRQQLFVVAVLELGSTNWTRAARMAGYTENHDSPHGGIRQTAWRLAHDEKVIIALNEEAKRRLQSSAPMAISELVKFAESESPLPEDRKLKLKAIDMILNRTGHHAKTEHKVEVKHEYTDAQAIERIATLARQVGVDPQKLLGFTKPDIEPAIDAEFTEAEEESINAESAEHSMDDFDWTGDEE